jgi:hypothetical protein
MEDVKVYSPIEDKAIRENLNGSPIWKKAYHAEDLPRITTGNAVVFEYSIKFEGLKPVQVTNVKKIAK